MFAFLRILAVAVVFCSGTGLARADYAASERWFNSLDEEVRAVVQANLVLLGHYDRLIDLEFGRGTFEALVTYQKKSGLRSNGVLSKAQQEKLLNDGAQVYSRLGIEVVEDSDLGLSMLLPLKLLEGRTEAPSGYLYFSSDGGIEVETERLPHGDRDFASRFDELSHPTNGASVAYKNYGEGDFTVSGRIADRFYYSRYYDDGLASVGFSVRWTTRYRTVGSIVSILLASLSSPLGGQAEQGPSALGQSSESYSSGSGFFFADKGMIATNYHVADGCSELTVVGHGRAILIRGDEDNDIAAVQLESKRSPRWAGIRETPPQLAEGVLLLGYPLADILEPSLNVSTGIVSSEDGPAGIPGWFTTNAGVQPGNSGGPLLDSSGNVIGMAVAKIDDALLLRQSGTTASNIGFAIKNTKLLEFLEIFQHSKGTATEPLSPQEVTQLGRVFTVQLMCREQAVTERN